MRLAVVSWSNSRVPDKRLGVTIEATKSSEFFSRFQREKSILVIINYHKRHKLITCDYKSSIGAVIFIFEFHQPKKRILWKCIVFNVSLYQLQLLQPWTPLLKPGPRSSESVKSSQACWNQIVICKTDGVLHESRDPTGELHYHWMKRIWH